MKKIAIVFAASVVAISVVVVWCAWRSHDTGVLEYGQYIVLALTLVVLVWYAYDTNRIARVTQERWQREGVLGTTYEIKLIGEKGDAGRTLVRLHNPSTLIVRAKIAFNLHVYGESVSAGALYNGEETWLLFPQQVSQGWFELESILQKKGKTVSKMIAECTEANRDNQLTALLEMEFWDELGEKRELPPRHHYFDFSRWAWIPQLAERKP